MHTMIHPRFTMSQSFVVGGMRPSNGRFQEAFHSGHCFRAETKAQREHSRHRYGANEALDSFSEFPSDLFRFQKRHLLAVIG